MSHYTMLSKYGNCTRLLKIKNKLKIGFLHIKSGRILDILWTFLIKQLFHSRLLDMRWLYPTRRYAPLWLTTISYSTGSRGIVVKYISISPLLSPIAMTINTINSNSCSSVPSCRRLRNRCYCCWVIRDFDTLIIYSRLPYIPESHVIGYSVGMRGLFVLKCKVSTGFLLSVHMQWSFSLERVASITFLSSESIFFSIF